MTVSVALGATTPLISGEPVCSASLTTSYDPIGRARYRNIQFRQPPTSARFKSMRSVASSRHALGTDNPAPPSRVGGDRELRIGVDRVRSLGH